MGDQNAVHCSSPWSHAPLKQCRVCHRQRDWGRLHRLQDMVISLAPPPPGAPLFLVGTAPVAVRTTASRTASWKFKIQQSTRILQRAQVAEVGVNAYFSPRQAPSCAKAEDMVGTWSCSCIRHSACEEFKKKNAHVLWLNTGGICKKV